MKKLNFPIFATLFAFAMSFSTLNAQNETGAFHQGATTFAVGHGFAAFRLSSFFTAYKSELGYTLVNQGPYFFKIGYGLTDNLEVGLNVNYSAENVRFVRNGYNYNVNHSGLSALLRGSFHFSVGERFDPYVTASLGYHRARFEYSDTDPNVNFDGGLSIPIPFSGEILAGASYYFVPNFGIYGEVGFSRALLQLGIVAKF